MAEALETTTEVQSVPWIGQKNPAPTTFWQRLGLSLVLLISLFMNFYQLGQNGFGNLYYATGVRSMLDNWHTFFFVSYDPGGFVSLDKPPLGFWLQVASARLFGFTPFSVYLPQALAGVLSVAVLYHLVRRHFGVVAGLLAALALAISPISVVTNRNNTIDSTLALVLLLGAWAVLRAAENGRLRWLLLCAITVGIGFNIKMLEAYLVVPAFGLLYLLAAPRSVWKRIGHLALAGALLLAISLSWTLVVDLTPTTLRPFVGSSQNNSEISLALGYNGISRLFGLFGPGGRTNTNAGSPNQPSNANGNGGLPDGNFPPYGYAGGSGTNGNGDIAQRQLGSGGPDGGFDTGTPGPLRLFNEPLGGQIAWLLPLAMLGILALAWQRRPRLQRDRQQQSLVLWGMWLLTMGVFFSVAGFIHQYYLTEMAPAIAALFGIGIVTMWRDYLLPGWRSWLLPLALVATAFEQMHILSSYPNWGQWLIPAIALLCMVGAVVLILLRPTWGIGSNAGKMRFLVPALSIAILSLLIAPIVWAGMPVIQNVQTPLPVAGPTQGNAGGIAGLNGGSSVDPTLIRYLEANQGNATFLVATASSNTADDIILATNKPVMALGGFGGSDPILTVTQLALLVKNGTVRYFLLSTFGSRFQPPQLLENISEKFPEVVRGGFGGGPQNSASVWVSQHCRVVPTSQWQSSSITDNPFGPIEATQLYDCTTTQGK